MNLARVGLAIVAIVAAVIAAYALFRALDERAAPPIVIEDAAALLPVVVDVRGAVVDPGVYELPAGARIQDAINASGGLAENADLSTINLARRLRDGEVVIVAELVPVGSTPSSLQPADLAEPNADVEPTLNINLATAEELEALPGIGEITAARIVAYREQNGPYRSIDDLIHVRGISTRTISGLRDMVTVAP